MEEIWKLFKDGYSYNTDYGVKKIEPIYVSNLGGIRGRKLSIDGYGYLKFRYKNKDYKLHKVIAELFIPYTGLNPDGTAINGKPQVNHKDENKLNNAVDNLEWCDVKYNINYGTRTKRMAKKHYKPIQCVETGEVFDSALSAEKYYKIRKNSVSNAANPNDHHQTAGNMHWKYI